MSQFFSNRLFSKVHREAGDARRGGRSELWWCMYRISESDSRKPLLHLYSEWRRVSLYLVVGKIFLEMFKVQISYKIISEYCDPP